MGGAGIAAILEMGQELFEGPTGFGFVAATADDELVVRTVAAASADGVEMIRRRRHRPRPSVHIPVAVRAGFAVVTGIAGRQAGRRRTLRLGAARILMSWANKASQVWVRPGRDADHGCGCARRQAAHADTGTSALGEGATLLALILAHFRRPFVKRIGDGGVVSELRRVPSKSAAFSCAAYPTGLPTPRFEQCSTGASLFGVFWVATAKLRFGSRAHPLASTGDAGGCRGLGVGGVSGSDTVSRIVSRETFTKRSMSKAGNENARESLIGSRAQRWTLTICHSKLR